MDISLLTVLPFETECTDTAAKYSVNQVVIYG